MDDKVLETAEAAADAIQTAPTIDSLYGDMTIPVEKKIQDDAPPPQPTPKPAPTPNHPATDKYPAYNLGSEEFRPWLTKLLSKGPMDALDVVQAAEQYFKKKMIEGDLIPKYDGKGKRIQFAHAWQHRLYCAREGMVKAGLMHEFKNFPSRPGQTRRRWGLTPKGMLREHRKGY